MLNQVRKDECKNRLISSCSFFQANSNVVAYLQRTASTTKMYYAVTLHELLK